MSSTHHPNRLVFYQSQEYTTRLFGRKKVIEYSITRGLLKPSYLDYRIRHYCGNGR